MAERAFEFLFFCLCRVSSEFLSKSLPFEVSALPRHVSKSMTESNSMSSVCKKRLKCRSDPYSLVVNDNTSVHMDSERSLETFLKFTNNMQKACKAYSHRPSNDLSVCGCSYVWSRTGKVNKITLLSSQCARAFLKKNPCISLGNLSAH